jgi:hypothetical protein
MPKKNKHVVFGSTAGALYSLSLSKDQEAGDRFIETLGGVMGGYCGGRAPDLLEPAHNSAHRAFAHSILAGTSSLAVIMRISIDWAVFFRSCADRLSQQRASGCSNDLDRLLSVTLDLFCRFGAGFGPGFIAGYISHLALDAGTPRSLPLI